jgi:hypothetical protein
MELGHTVCSYQNHPPPDCTSVETTDLADIGGVGVPSRCRRFAFSMNMPFRALRLFPAEGKEGVMRVGVNRLYDRVEFDSNTPVATLGDLFNTQLRFPTPQGPVPMTIDLLVLHTV